VGKPAPIFRGPEETYEADACLPLVEAARGGRIRLEALVHGHYPGRRLPHGALPGLKTAGFWDAEEDQNWGLPWHRNEGIELTLLESGSLGFSVDDREYLLEAGNLTVTRPWQRHRVGKPNVDAGRLLWLIVDVGVRRPNQAWKWPAWLVLSEADRDELTNILRNSEQPVWRASGEIRRCFQGIAHIVESDHNGGQVSRLAVRLNELVLAFLDLLRQHDLRLDQSLSSSRRTVQLFLADLRSHLEHLALEWTVEEMARLCGLGVTQFVHHVRSLVNMTPMHYLNHCRLGLGARMLREHPEKTVTDVALTCGFGSSQYFATAFGARFGRTPREFRRLGSSSPGE